MGNSVIYRPAYDAEVEYLESTGDQWIDTGLTSTSSTIIEVDAQSTMVQYQDRFVGNSTGYLEIYISGGLLISFAYNNKTLNTQVPADTTRHTLKIDNYNAKAYIDGSEIDIERTSTYGTITILSRGAELIPKAKLYSAKIWNGSTLVRNFIPVRIGSIGYMYDKVSKQLFANKGTGNFILGNDVSNAVIPHQRCVILFPRYDSQVEYLESDGNSFIDTGLNASSELGILAHIQNSQDKDGWAFGGNDSVGNKELSFAPKNELNQSLWRFDSYITQLNALNSASIYELSNIQNHNVLKIGESTYTATNSTFESQNNLSLFARGSSPLKGVRIYDFKIYQNSTLVRDFIPVRIGQVGYMYDKVSKRLFENKGSGNFILGSDTNDAVASQRSVGYERIYEVYHWLIGDQTAYINVPMNFWQNGLDINIGKIENPTYGQFFITKENSNDTYGRFSVQIGSNSSNMYLLVGFRDSDTTSTHIADISPYSSVPSEVNMQFYIDDGIAYCMQNGTLKTGLSMSESKWNKDIAILGKLAKASYLREYNKSDNSYIRNLIPVKLLQSIPAILDGNGIARQAGECGMWDKVSNRFYGNVANSGSFTVSND